MAVTSYGRNKNHDDEIKKNQEKANNSPSYRCAAINKRHAGHVLNYKPKTKLLINRTSTIFQQHQTSTVNKAQDHMLIKQKLGRHQLISETIYKIIDTKRPRAQTVLLESMTDKVKHGQRREKGKKYSSCKSVESNKIKNKWHISH